MGCDVSPVDATEPPAFLTPIGAELQCLGTYQAEAATIVGGAVHAHNMSEAHTGFLGDSFVDYLHPSDDYIEWTVPSCSGGAATASFRYSLAAGNRPQQVLVNGEEVEPSLTRISALRDLESNETVIVDPAFLQSGYQSRFKAHCESIERACRRIGADYTRVMTTEPLDAALQSYLRFRERRGR